VGIIAIGCYEECDRDQGLRDEVIAIPSDVYLLHRCRALAKELTTKKPLSRRILRGDPGADDKQYRQDVPPLTSAEIFYNDWVAGEWTTGFYTDVQGPCEYIANSDPEKIRFRIEMEYWLARIVHAHCKRPDGTPAEYHALACPTANLDGGHLAMFENEVRLLFGEADWINYHGYLREWATRIDQEVDGNYLWRPFAHWLDTIRRINRLRDAGQQIRFPGLFLGEAGTFYHPEKSKITQEDEARLVIAIAKAVAIRASLNGVRFLGATNFGFGTVGEMEPWEQRGCGSIYREAIEKMGDASSLGEGFKRAIAAGLLPAFEEGELYHFFGTDEETSMAVGRDGFATWRKETNSTTIQRDDGAIWTDRGNRGDGRFVRID
jgi:hypothetical protein